MAASEGNTGDHEDEAFRSLALQLLAARYSGKGGRAYASLDELHLLPGQLPPALPFDLTVPPDGMVVGSFVRPYHATIILEVNRPPQEVFDFYESLLASQGWGIRPFGGERGGFPSVHSAANSRSFLCRGRSSPMLVMDVLSPDGATTEVEFDVSTHPDDKRCSQDEELRERIGRSGFVMYDRLPTLLPPRGATQAGSAGACNTRSAWAVGRLFTTLDLPPIARHYAKQLEAAGWVRRDEGGDQWLVWTTWGMQDETGQRHQGLWFALRTPYGPGRYVLYIHTARSGPAGAGEPQGGASWGTFGGT
ncbi:MAG: hypothetical protein JOZ41_10760 [Chloroflexi bacterium]|nr:hypothetical protein [Chloroflexota bacterium]